MRRRALRGAPRSACRSCRPSMPSFRSGISTGKTRLDFSDPQRNPAPIRHARHRFDHKHHASTARLGLAQTPPTPSPTNPLPATIHPRTMTITGERNQVVRDERPFARRQSDSFVLLEQHENLPHCWVSQEGRLPGRSVSRIGLEAGATAQESFRRCRRPVRQVTRSMLFFRPRPGNASSADGFADQGRSPGQRGVRLVGTEGVQGQRGEAPCGGCPGVGARRRQALDRQQNEHEVIDGEIAS